MIITYLVTIINVYIPTEWSSSDLIRVIRYIRGKFPPAPREIWRDTPVVQGESLR